MRSWAGGADSENNLKGINEVKVMGERYHDLVQVQVNSPRNETSARDQCGRIREL